MFNHSKALKQAFLLSMLLASASLVSPSYGQSFSHDGNRWYEVEISIFSNLPLNLADAEIEIPSRTSLSYPRDILQLSPASASFAYEFNESDLSHESLMLTAPLWSELPVQPPNLGPQYSPAQEGFRIASFDSDAFIALGTEHQQFSRINERISTSEEHRLLYHSVWRQPVLNRVQSSAIFISGGEQYGEHNELEGSIRISYNVNRIDLDADLWLSRFVSNLEQRASIWSVPSPAFANTLPETLASSINNLQIQEQLLVLDNVAHMDEVRSMRSSTFHYLDHPAFGLLVEIRPYQLPDSFDTDTTFEAGFE